MELGRIITGEVGELVQGQVLWGLSSFVLHWLLSEKESHFRVLSRLIGSESLKESL